MSFAFLLLILSALPLAAGASPLQVPTAAPDFPAAHSAFKSRAAAATPAATPDLIRILTSVGISWMHKTVLALPTLNRMPRAVASFAAHNLAIRSRATLIGHVSMVWRAQSSTWLEDKDA